MYLLQGPHASVVGREMALNVFLAFFILSTDFTIYAFFQWTYGAHHDAF